MSILGNGPTAGIVVMIVSLTTLLELTSPRSRKLEVTLGTSSLPKIDAFLQDFAAGIGWNEASSANRLRACGEESLLSLLPSENGGSEASTRLIVLVRSQDDIVAMDLLTLSAEDRNIEDRLAYMSEEAEVHDDRELSFRLLRLYASSVHHRKYYGADVVTVKVERTE